MFVPPSELSESLFQIFQISKIIPYLSPKSAFKKYLPAVLNENVSIEAKQSLNEGKVTEHTGDRGEEVITSESPSQGSDANIIQLKKLAGLK